MSDTNSSELLHVALPCDRSAPAAAREAVRELQANGEVPEEAVLLVSELVSSEVLERGCAECETMELTACHVPDGVRIAVDTGPNGRLVGPHPLVGRVIRGLAHRWGIASFDGSHELWAELAL